MKNAEQSQIDFVITWVDGSDVEWLKEKKKYNPGLDIDDSAARYRDFGTLKYVFRSIEKFAPWVKNIYLVTNGQVPEWLDTENDKVKLIKHSNYIPKEYLPTFNSHPIEWNFNKIRGLSENFVYFNDDVILTAPVKPTDFFKDGLPCDSFGLELLAPSGFFSNIAFNNMVVVNKHFDFKETVKKNKKKFFCLKYGKSLAKTMFLSTRGCFYYINEPHISMAFKKSYFDLLWEKEHALIDETCKNRFRSKNDVSPWLVRYWQLLNGDFSPRSAKWGKVYSIHDLVRDKSIKKELKSGKHKVVCINDNDVDFMEFEKEREIFEETMDTVLGERCSFEKQI